MNTLLRHDNRLEEISPGFLRSFEKLEGSLEAFNREIVKKGFDVRIRLGTAQSGEASFEQGLAALEKGIAVLGMSFYHPDFSRRRCAVTLTQGVAECSREIKVMIPYGPAKFTELAAGRLTEKVIQDVTVETHKLKNYVALASRTMGAVPSRSVEVVPWHSVYRSEPFRKAFRTLSELYDSQANGVEDGMPNFARDVNEQTTRVLTGRAEALKKRGEPLLPIDREKALKTGVKFLLQEYAYIVSAPEIYTKPVCYVYTAPMYLLDGLICGLYGNAPIKDLGMIVFNVDHQ